MKDMPALAHPPLSRFFRLAVLAGAESAVQLHINRGDDLDARDAKGQTPLMISAARNKAAICRLLLAAGADANVLDSSGRSARDIAQSAGALEAAEAIEAACTPHTPSHHGNRHWEPSPVVAGGQGTTTRGDASARGQVAVNDKVDDRQSTLLPRLDTVGTPDSVFGSGSDAGDQGDSDDFDLTGWEVDEDQPAPAGDPTLSAAASEIQSAITAHHPIDTSTDWDDYEA